MKKIKKMLLAVLLIITMILPIGCSSSNNLKVQNEFDEFTNEVFRYLVTTDSITLNYTLSNPANYGINDFVPTLGECTKEDFTTSLVESENFSKRLKEFKVKDLTKDQQLTYDILEKSLSFPENITDYYLLYEYLSPSLGIQAQLPVLLAEYNFYTKADIESYLKLLPTVYDYFSQIIEFEKEKSQAGYFMTDKIVEEVIMQCKTFIEDKDNNFLIEIFNERIDAYEGLTEDERTTFKENNKTAILEKVIPAYELLIEEITKLKGTGTNDAGLCNYTEGKEFYEYLVKDITGSSKSMDELTKLLEAAIKTNMAQLFTCMTADSSIMENYESIKYPYSEPTEILNYLKENIKNDYPELEEVNCTLKYVHPSLEDYLSPAFYLTPAIDNWKENSIYINQSEKFKNANLFTTVAHEGYPGHLFQMVYFNQQNPKPIRSVLDFGGYSEGWATYVEMDSYYRANLPTNTANLLKSENALTLCLYARADIGIHYEGWDKQKTLEYLTTYFGDVAETIIDDFYYPIIEDPGNYLKYTIGYLEFVGLRTKAENKLGDKFVAKDFHEFLLSTGPAPFEVIDKYMDKWIKNNK